MEEKGESGGEGREWKRGERGGRGREWRGRREWQEEAVTSLSPFAVAVVKDHSQDT